VINLQTVSKLTMMCLISALSLACQVSGSSQLKPQEVDDQARIRQLIANLSKDDLSEKAQSELLAIAKRSTINRDRIVQDLIADVNSHEELRRQQLILNESFYYWYRTVRIFSLLKATEAIDVMIQCIHCGNGMTGSLSVQPAFGALQAMGGLAVPKLSSALREHPNQMVRAYVALCLGTIGGSEAEAALQNALRTETDASVIHHIKLGLATIANNPAKNQ